jgi:hypothetical protein
MGSLKVDIEANGIRRSFAGDGDNVAVVAAFRMWLASPSCYVDMADGADVVDQAAVNLERAARTVPAGNRPGPASAADRPERIRQRIIDEAFCVPDWLTFDRLLDCVQGYGVKPAELRGVLVNLVREGLIRTRTAGHVQQYQRTRSILDPHGIAKPFGTLTD